MPGLAAQNQLPAAVVGAAHTEYLAEQARPSKPGILSSQRAASTAVSVCCWQKSQQVFTLSLTFWMDIGLRQCQQAAGTCSPLQPMLQTSEQKP